jgi:hypothetical protein
MGAISTDERIERKRLLSNGRAAKYRATHREEIRARDRARDHAPSSRRYYAAHRAQETEKRRTFYADNRERELGLAKHYYAMHREEACARARARSVEQKRAAYECAARKRREHPEIVNAANAARYCAQRRALPAWADLDAIRGFYERAAKLTRETGIEHHVDHFYPLRGKTVCGLHVAANLRVITGAENCHKSNKYPVEVVI